MVGYKVRCINDSNRPDEFPESNWVKKDSIYTVSKLDKMHMQGSIYGIQVEEIKTDHLFPYTHFALSRFVIIDDDGPLSDEELESLLSEIEVKELELIS